MVQGQKRPLAVRLEEFSGRIRRQLDIPNATWDEVHVRLKLLVETGTPSDAMAAIDQLVKMQKLSMEGAQMEMASSRAARDAQDEIPLKPAPKPEQPIDPTKTQFAIEVIKDGKKVDKSELR
jgi:hypothetical protein